MRGEGGGLGLKSAKPGTNLNMFTSGARDITLYAAKKLIEIQVNNSNGRIYVLIIQKFHNGVLKIEEMA